MTKISQLCRRLAAVVVGLALATGLLWQTAPVFARTGDSEPAASLEIRAHYKNMEKGAYESVKVLPDSYFTGAAEKQTFMFVDSLPTLCVAPASGVYLKDLLAHCGLKEDDVAAIHIWCTDGPADAAIRHFTRQSLFDTARYYYPKMLNGGIWEAAEGMLGIRLIDPAQATADAVQVEPMIARADNWQRVKGEGAVGELDLGYANLRDAGRYRLMFGLPKPGGGAKKDVLQANAADSMKWIYRMDVDLAIDKPGGAVTPGDSTTPTNPMNPAVPVNPVKPPEPSEETILAALPDIRGHWAQDGIVKLVKAGAIAGYPDGAFKPENPIKRAEFAAILVKVLIRQEKLTLTAGAATGDATAHWAAVWLATAVQAGIICPDEKGDVYPERLITRQEIACMVARALKLTGDPGALNFADKKQIAEWAAPSVAALLKNGGLTGFPDGRFRPAANATRAQAALVIDKALAGAGSSL